MDRLVYLLSDLHNLNKFYSKCPPGKRGRPLGIATAVQLEKSQPGSVCAKEAVARRGANAKGARTLLYRTNSAGAKLKTRSEKAGAGRQENKKEAPRKQDKTPQEEQAPMMGVSKKQIGWAKTIAKIQASSLQQSRYEEAPEALSNLRKINQAGEIFARKDLNQKPLIASLLPADKLKEFAKKHRMDLTGKYVVGDNEPLSKPFISIMRRTLSKDNEYFDAVKAGRPYPYFGHKKEKVDKKEAKPSAPPAPNETKATSQEADEDAVDSLIGAVLNVDDDAILEELAPQHVEESKKEDSSWWGRLWGKGKERLKQAKDKIKEVKKKAIEHYLQTPEGKELVSLIKANRAKGKIITKDTAKFVAKMALKYGKYLSMLGI